MSLFTLTSGLLSIKPKVWEENGTLCARTSLLVQILSLGSYAKHVRIDPKTRTIQINTRRLWSWPSQRRIPFDNVAWINYNIGSFGTGWSFWTNDGFGRTDEVERYRVGLALKNPPKNIRLFSFVGEGSVETGWTGVLWGDDSAVDVRGNQDQAAGDFVSILRHLLGVGVNGPLPGTEQEDDDEEPMHKVIYRCAECGRESPPMLKKCRFCPGRIESCIE